MEQMITNIWNLNALIGGILVFLILVLMTILLLVGILFAPFKHHNED